MKPSGGAATIRPGHSWQFTVGSRQEEVCSKQLAVGDQQRLQIVNDNCKLQTGNCKLNTKSRSSVWLEHYTDNVGVSSSNLLGTTGNE